RGVDGLPLPFRRDGPQDRDVREIRRRPDVHGAPADRVRRRRGGRRGRGNRSTAHRMGLQRLFRDGQGHGVLLDATIGRASGVQGQQRG
ncbi:unnamed protein product, partial [Sphagnum jensenii]